MIQRKQTLWLFIASLLNLSVFFTGLYKYTVAENGADVTKLLRVNDHYPSMIISLVLTLLPLVTIFMYRQRTRQIRMTLANIMATGSFITMLLMRVNSLGKAVPAPTGGSYQIGSLLPAVSLLFLILAILAIL